MITLRIVLASLLVVVGCSIIVRMLGLGLHPEIFPGVLLGAAMVALGVHRIALVRRVYSQRKAMP
jgi:hypothetical protein